MSSIIFYEEAVEYNNITTQSAISKMMNTHQKALLVSADQSSHIASSAEKMCLKRLVITRYNIRALAQ